MVVNEPRRRRLPKWPALIVAALLAVYLILGVLYESLVHPLTILSTLPSAAIGALAFLWLGGFDFSIMALIGVILLIGIVKKNAIMMIDVALAAERRHGVSAQVAIHAAARLRLRPILMTTLAALLGALPLAFGTGLGAELRRPLGIAIIGGLLVAAAYAARPVPLLCLPKIRSTASRPAAYFLFPSSTVKVATRPRWPSTMFRITVIRAMRSCETPSTSRTFRPVPKSIALRAFGERP